MALRLGIFILLILGIFFSIGVNQSHALSCAMPKFLEAYLEHDLLLHGNLIEKKIDYGENAHRELATLIFEPIKVYKGTHNEKFIIQADLYWDDYYREGSDYILFADRDGENYFRELCVGDYLSSPSIINFLDEFLQNPEVAQDVSLLYDVTSETERKILDDTLKQYSILNREEELNPKLDFDNAILEPFAYNELVIVGKIINVNKIVTENKTKYDIQVQEYLKNPRSFEMITAFFDGMQPEDFSFPGPITYYNQPFFDKDNHVFVYLNEENGQFKISSHSFAIEKNEPKGPVPNILDPTSRREFQFNQGDEIMISGLIKKAFLYISEIRGDDSSLTLTILDKNDEIIVSEKLDVKVDGTYEFPFQLKGESRIPGIYSYEISVGHRTLHDDEFIIKMVPSLWTPLKQLKSGIESNQVICNEGLKLMLKPVEFTTPVCVTTSTYNELDDRGWMPVLIKG